MDLRAAVYRFGWRVTSVVALRQLTRQIIDTYLTLLQPLRDLLVEFLLLIQFIL